MHKEICRSSSDCRSDWQKLYLKNLRKVRDFIKKQNRQVSLDLGEKQGTQHLHRVGCSSCP